MMKEILEILQKDARTTPEEMASLLGLTPAEVKKEIRRLEKEGVILKYKAVVNSEALSKEERPVRALIEVKTIPQKNVGFDRIAERIYLFPEVKCCYLLSGGYDLLLTVEGSDIQSIGSFVAEKLAPMENVQGTVTHFLLKKYKEDGDMLVGKPKDRRLAVTP
ncbi:MAG: Lrp/AsnC family transcriptional regulator [Candidatus Aureabacteria bacterium]|nr:Lrp/AsnC family transcriptional regulator [Candidatus Auribacterota bacterium]